MLPTYYYHQTVRDRQECNLYIILLLKVLISNTILTCLR